MTRTDQREPARPSLAAPPLLQELVAPRSDRPAVRCAGRELGYASMHRRAAEIAAFLKARGIGREEPVGVCVADPVRLLPALLGVLGAHGAYAPLDPGWPQARLNRIARRIGLRTVLTTADLADGLGGEDFAAVPLEHVPELGVTGETTPGGETDGPPGTLAYVITTSGSTGVPKSVGIGHRAAVESALARRRHYSGTVERFLWHSPPAFDSSLAGLFWTLGDGGTLVVPEPDARTDPERLLALVKAEEITHALCLPRVWREMLRIASPGDLGTVRTAVVAGETVPGDLLALHEEKCGAPLWNEYGPAEGAVWATAHLCDAAKDTRTVPIGMARPDMEVLLVGDDLRLCEPGGRGEIWLGGAALARGYLGAAAQTAERFVPSPTRPGERAYRTGDLAVMRADGTLEFTGRRDEQIKISGIRVEVAEVERALLSVPGVDDAAVVARVAAEGRPALVAFVASAGDPGSVRDALRDLLPAAMVPAVLVPMDVLPRNANGKVDKAALRTAALPERPRSAAEEVPQELLDEVTEAWRKVLGDPELRPGADLFASGGDSISAVMICSELGRRGLAAAPYEVFEARSPRRLAALLAGRPPEPEARAPDAGDDPSGVGGVLSGSAAAGRGLPLSPIQRWFLRLCGGDDRVSRQWNLSVGLDVRRGDPDRVRAVLTQIMERHRMLGAVLRRAPGSGEWELHPGAEAVPVVLEYTDEPDEDGSWARERVAHWQASLNPAEGPVCRLVWLQGPGRRARCAMVAHHLVTDVVSWRLLAAELRSALLTGRVPPAGPDPSGWLARQHELIQAGHYDGELPHWLETSRSAAVPLSPAAAGTEGTARRYVRTVGGSVAERLLRLGASRPGAAPRVLLAALARGVRAAFPEAGSFGVDVEAHGRSEAGMDGAGAVGWYTSFHPVALDLTGAEDAAVAMSTVQDALDRVPGQGLGYLGLAHVRRGLPGTDGLCSAPSPAVGFNYLGRLEERLEAGDHLLTLDSDLPGQRAENAPRAHLIDLDCLVAGDELVFRWAFPDDPLFPPHVAKALADAVTDGVEACLEVADADIR